jgi:prolyl oligopeptidase
VRSIAGIVRLKDAFCFLLSALSFLLYTSIINLTRMKKYLLLTLLSLTFIGMLQSQTEDPYLWLEEVNGAKALEFVNQHNLTTIEKLSKEESYQRIYDKSLEIYNSTDRIIYPSLYPGYVYNFWQDKEHVRGIWRRSPQEDYLSGNPKWQILLDIDEMSRKDNVQWVFKGASGCFPKFDRFIVSLSKGGGDATIKREFDVKTMKFVEDGFNMPESKGGGSYLDENTLIVGTNFGKNTMTTSGYPRQARIWKRGTPLKDAKLVLDGDSTDVSTYGYVMRDGDKNYLMFGRSITFYSKSTFIWQDNKLVKLDIPDDADINGLLNNQLIIELKSDWKIGDKKFAQGSLISLDFAALIKGEHRPLLVFEQDEVTSLSGVSSTKTKLLVNLLSNVKSELYIYSFDGVQWSRVKVPAPDFGTIAINATDDEFSDRYFFTFTNFLSPPTLYFADAAVNTVKIYKSLPAFFDASKYTVQQYKAKSTDGTLVPYFVVASKDLKYDGNNPTHLYAYGGFEVPMLPSYSGILGKAWLENGGVYVLANIRGGGEFGPRWHQAGLKEKRQIVFDDFYAVAEDLIAKKITSPRHLGISGGSNGGLLMGVAFTQRPELFNAVVCAVPLLDMKRYNKLLAGASWMGEYGDPDKPEQWAYISKYSPYHNVKAKMKYPEVFFYTSTRDDRVHPGHARKMVALMSGMGYPVYYFENIEGGHAGSSTNEQRARMAALQYSYLLMKLK